MSDAALTSLHLHHPLHQEDGGPDLRVLAVELNHGRANEMGKAELLEWAALTARLQQGEVRALITYSRRRSASGKGIFISGANVTERTGWPEDRIKEHVRRQRAVLARLRHAPVFHVAVINGIALGWGTEFLICCDYRIACEEAKMGLPETGLGILPGAGGSSELWAMIGVSQALKLGMTGLQIDANEARRIDLVQEVCPDIDAALARARLLVGATTRRSPTALAAFKAAVLANVGLSMPERQSVEAAAYEHCVDSGEASVGRANFDAILKGQPAPWGPLKRWMP